jgi:hypothetical protein
MKATPTFVLLLAIGISLHAAEVEIISLSANGRLTFTSSYTNGVFSVQWSPELPSTSWSANWDSLHAFVSTNARTTVSVPMFYRVACQTNQFFPTPIGRQSVFTITNDLGATGNLRVTFVGALKLSSGKDYTILEMLDDRDCALRLMPCRSTDTELYTIPFEISKSEYVAFRSGSPGTTWTNQWCDGSSDQVTISANEVVTVPAGTFECLKTEDREINNNLRLRWVYWIKPGMGMVKQVDYGNGTKPPDTYTLSSWTDSPPR